MPCPFCEETTHGMLDYCVMTEQIKRNRLQQFIYCENSIVRDTVFQHLMITYKQTIERNRSELCIQSYFNRNVNWLASKLRLSQPGIPISYIKYFAVFYYGVDEDHPETISISWLFEEIAKYIVTHYDQSQLPEMQMVDESETWHDVWHPVRIRPLIEKCVIPNCEDRDNCEICGIEDRTCPICYNDIQDKFKIAITNCKHLFCKSCIYLCTQNSRHNCPMCREKINRLNIHVELYL
jgi:hypothetical protein